MSVERWGRMVNRWHDEVGPCHLLKEDNSPACGTSYYASSGAIHPGTSWKCGNCKRISVKLGHCLIKEKREIE